MKTLGLIGGMTWHSTVDYYRLINQGVQDAPGRLTARPRCSCLGGLRARPGPPGPGGLGRPRPADGPGRPDARRGRGRGHRHLRQHHAPAGRRTSKRRSASRSSTSPTLPGPRPKRRAWTSVGLLGTRYTMEMDFYRTRLEKAHGLKVLVPGRARRGRSSTDIIYDELGRGDRPRGVAAGLCRDHRGPRGAAGPRASSWAARRSRSSSRRRTAPSRSSTRRPSTPPPRSSSPWADRFRHSHRSLAAPPYSFEQAGPPAAGARGEWPDLN